jgi:hypothetical protein
MTVLADQMDGVIGVDTHRDTLTAAAGPPPCPWVGCWHRRAAACCLTLALAVVAASAQQAPAMRHLPWT